MITIHKDGKVWQCEASGLAQITGVPYFPGIQFIDFRTFKKISKMLKKPTLDTEHKWLSAYFRKEVVEETGGPSHEIIAEGGGIEAIPAPSATTQSKELSCEPKCREFMGPPRLPPISLRWIDDEIGWGVFAEQEIQQTEFIAKYSGIVRKRVRRDSKNAYCFEYPLELVGSGEPSPYVIDAQDIGGISRYINHSDTPNLTSCSVHVEGVNHIILYTIKKIPKGEQLCYDYGPGYWQTRGNPRNFNT